MMLCHMCQGIFQGSFRDRKWQPHHDSMADLYHAARQECYICEKLWAELIEQYWVHYDYLGEKTIGELTIEEKERLMLQDFAASLRQCRPSQPAPVDAILSLADLDILSHGSGQARETELPSDDKHIIWAHYPLSLQWILKQIDKTAISIEFYSQVGLDTGRNGQPGFNPYFSGFTPHVQEDFDASVSFQRLTTRRSSMYSIQLAKYWVERCMNSHPKCINRRSSWLPTRLLHLEDSRAPIVRLVSTDDGSVQGPYMTLSHCWGKADFYKHTTKTSAELFAGIKTTLLPQTFRDAIHTTLRLNIRYLWIDSLCIVQDDPRDWLRESSIMGQVYKNGYCNIAATNSMAADNGFLAQRSPITQSPKPACYILSAWNEKDNFHWVLHSLYTLRPINLLSGPLLSRGWVVQERLMAPRTLHFVSNQLYWECYQHDACELYPQGVPSQIWAFIYSPEPGIKHRHRSLHMSSDFSDTMALWANIVAVYSECQLTIEKDKLVALSGAAKTIQKKLLGSLGSQYLAGLWRYDFESQLVWSTKDGARTRPKAYRAPSWSWASIDGPVFMADQRQDPYNGSYIVEILEAVTKPLGTDPTGQVESGFIRLVAPLLTLSVRAHSSLPVFYGGDAKINCNWQEQHSIKPDIDEDPTTHLHCLPVWSSTNILGTTFSCLIVRPSGREGQKGVFERWGVVDGVSFEDYGVPTVDNVPVWSKIRNESWLEFEEDHGDGRYTVTVI